MPLTGFQSFQDAAFWSFWVQLTRPFSLFMISLGYPLRLCGSHWFWTYLYGSAFTSISTKWCHLPTEFKSIHCFASKNLRLDQTFYQNTLNLAWMGWVRASLTKMIQSSFKIWQRSSETSLLLTTCPCPSKWAKCLQSSAITVLGRPPLSTCWQVCIRPLRETQLSTIIELPRTFIRFSKIWAFANSLMFFLTFLRSQSIWPSFVKSKIYQMNMLKCWFLRHWQLWC